MTKNRILVLVALAMTAGFCATYTIAQTGGACESQDPSEKEVAALSAGVKVVKQISDLTTKPNLAGIIAVGGIKDDVKGTDAEKIEHLEDLLKNTKSLTMRNSIHMTLNELYQETNQNDKLVKSLKEMAAENDASLVKWEAIMAKAMMKK